MALVVMKFGGTSVADWDARRHVTDRIRDELERGSQVVVVVSAMGRKGAPYATDTLLSLLGEDADPATRDLLMNCGETISACVLAYELSRSGIPARPFTGEDAGIRTDDNFGAAQIIGMDTTGVRETLADGILPVITGFQGRTADGRATTIGRGGSDTSAVVIGGYLQADRVDIYTDVPGIARVDPRIVPDTEFMEVVSGEDMLRLATWGAGVIHQQAVAAGMAFQIPALRVRSTFQAGEGTIICREKGNEGFVGAALLKNLELDEQGNIQLGERRYQTAEHGPLAIVTALVHDLKEEKMSALRALDNRILVADDLLQTVVPMEAATATAKAFYDILSRSDRY